MLIENLFPQSVFGKGFHCCRPNGLEDWNLFVLFRSETYVFQDGGYVLAEPGSYCIFRIGKHTEYYPKGESFHHEYFHFACENQEEERILERLPQEKVTRLYYEEEIRKLLQMMKKENEGGGGEFSPLSALGRYFFLKLSELSELDGHSRIDDTRYLNFTALHKNIQAHPEWEWNVEETAANMFLSVSRFQHLYTELFGVSFRNDVISARMKLARSLLWYSSYSVREVAEQCGWNHTEHFIRQFKKHFGTTPYQFRKQQN